MRTVPLDFIVQNLVSRRVGASVIERVIKLNPDGARQGEWLRGLPPRERDRMLVRGYKRDRLGSTKVGKRRYMSWREAEERAYV